MAKSSKPAIRYYLEVQHDCGKWEFFILSYKKCKELMLENKDNWKRIRLLKKTTTLELIVKMVKNKTKS